MIYKYNLMVPLIYNRFNIIDSEHDTELRLGLKEEVCASFEVIFRSYDIPSHPDGCDFKDIAQIKLFTWNDEDYESTGSTIDTKIHCMILGLICENKREAKKYIKEIVDKICKELSLVFSRYNHNRHLFHPRIEPDWNSAKWDEKEYKPYSDAITKGESGGIITARTNIMIECSAYAIITNLIPPEEIIVDKWLQPKDDNLEFLINEYYSALGAEKIKSKFFHLFAMIEFCEEKYKKHNKAERLFSDDYVEKILQVLEGSKEVDTDKDVLGEVKKALSRRTDIGRAQKLLNILNWMGIDKFERFGEEKEIDKKMLDDAIDLRNRSFHGGQERAEEVEQEYKRNVENLLYIDEKIIEFVRGQSFEAKRDTYCLCIEGQKK